MAKKEIKEVAEVKATEAKAAEKFDRKALFTEIQKAFAKNEIADVVADTDREDSINCAEYEYIHFYKKGTETNLFQLYIKNKDCKFVVGLTLKDFLKQGDNYTLTGVEKTKGGEKKVVYIRVTCNHEDTVDVANTILQAYQTKITQVVEVPEKPAKKEAKKETKKAPVKKTKATTKKVEKKAVNK